MSDSQLQFLAIVAEKPYFANKNVLNVYDFTVICCKSGRLFGIYAKNMVNFFYFVI